MERKKEKIMLLSLQRRQQQEETKARKEIEAMQRREREREKEDERVRKREEQAARRAAILEQHKLKKAIEEAEQKGISLDRNELMALKQQHSLLASSLSSGSSVAAGPKLRPQKVVRPRPKTIHVETGSVDLSEASSLSSRNKKGSNSNLTGKKSGHTTNDTLVFTSSLVVFYFSSSFAVINILRFSNSNFRHWLSSIFFRLCNFCFVFFFRYVFASYPLGIGQLSSNSIRRDYYRGSQDSLAIRGERFTHIKQINDPYDRCSAFSAAHV